MRNVFKNFLPYKKTVLMIMILLVVQAYCMLSLPQYTSDIIDTGIQNKGQEHMVPSKIKSEDFEQAKLFMNDNELRLWDTAYQKSDDGKTYNLKTSDDELSKLDDKLLVPLALSYQFEKLQEKSGEASVKNSDENASATENTSTMDAELAVLKEQIGKEREKLEKTIDKVGEKTVKSITFFVNYTYEDIVLFDENLGVGSVFGSGEETDYVLTLLHKGYKGEYFADDIIFHPAKKGNYDDLDRAYKYALGYGALVKKEVLGRKNFLYYFKFLKRIFYN